MERSLYDSSEWRRLREQARQRDGYTCSVGHLFGGGCYGLLHGHHIDPDGDPLDLDNVGTVCQRHHPQWEAVRRAVVQHRPRRRTCRHRHPYRGGREACERRLNAAA